MRVSQSLVLVLSLFCFTLTFGQTSKRKSNPKTDEAKPYETRCGVRYKNVDEFLEEIQKNKEKEWVGFAASNSSRYFYSPKRNLCEQGGTLKVWIKVVERDTTQRLSYELNQYELDCRKDKTRVLSGTLYDKNGEVIKIEHLSDREKEWEDIVPESVGERVFVTVCHKPD